MRLFRLFKGLGWGEILRLPSAWAHAMSQRTATKTNIGGQIRGNPSQGRLLSRGGSQSRTPQVFYTVPSFSSGFHKKKQRRGGRSKGRSQKSEISRKNEGLHPHGTNRMHSSVVSRREYESHFAGRLRNTVRNCSSKDEKSSRLKRTTWPTKREA